VSIGTAGALLVAAWASRGLATQLPFQDDLVSLELVTDWRVLAFTVGLASVAVMLFGTVPALYTTSVPPIEALRDGGRSAGGRQMGLLFSGLALGGHPHAVLRVILGRLPCSS
jgi:hypothetical protein